jgi:ABC-2 type transport system ATP-binding protein
VLELDRLTRRFGHVVALDNLSFTVHAGQVFGFLGPNGAGKTTAMRAVLGISALDAGEVRWKGSAVTAEDRRRFGYMPEARGLYPSMIVREQLEYLAELRGIDAATARKSVMAWLDRLGIADRADDKLEALSLGNQQRVQLAAAFVHAPELLILDEPFSGLDPVGIDNLSGLLHEQAESGATVVFSSHQLDLVERLCHRVGIIRSGQMVAVGTVDELRAGATTRLVVDAPQAGPDWADALPGVSLVGWEGHRVVLELAHGVDDQVVLQTALATGPVREFTRRQASLTELFRNVVSSNGEQP